MVLPLPIWPQPAVPVLPCWKKMILPAVLPANPPNSCMAASVIWRILNLIWCMSPSKSGLSSGRRSPIWSSPMPFVVPVYKNDKRPLWMMRLGVWLYDFLSGKYRIGHHRFLSVAEIISLAPGINLDGLVGGVEYFDAQMDDARICLENVLMADMNGALSRPIILRSKILSKTIINAPSVSRPVIVLSGATHGYFCL